MRGETSYGDSVVATAQAREPPEPLVFTEAAIEEATGEPAPTVRSIETLFTRLLTARRHRHRNKSRSYTCL